MDGELKYEYKLLETQIGHLKDLMTQHDKLTEIAINKAETTLNERLEKVNEFREQQKDIIATFAPLSEMTHAFTALRLTIENDKKSVTERYEANSKTLHDKITELDKSWADKKEIMRENIESKINSLEAHISERIVQMRVSVDDKRDTLYNGVLQMFKSVEEKNIANIKNETSRFEAVDKQMQLLIDNNAEKSNEGISLLNTWKDNIQGSLRVIVWMIGFLTALVVGLLIAYFKI